MSLTYSEINNQYEALMKTINEFEKKRENINHFFTNTKYRSLTFIGCGSSYFVTKSLAAAANMSLDIPIYAFTAGDLWINNEKYRKQLEGTLLIAISRSGMTSEVINAIDILNRDASKPLLSITCTTDSTLSQMSDCVLELPWAFDESVCQTRCVTNIYAAGSMIVGLLSGSDSVLQDMKRVASLGDSYMWKYEGELKKLAQGQWTNVVVLADAELGGLAEEGALAFKEISQVASNFYNILDSRHGPMVLIGSNTLVIIMLNTNQCTDERNLVENIIAKGSAVITCSRLPVYIEGVKLNACIGVEMGNIGAGALYVSICQLLAYFKSFVTGCDPDAPDGLEPWIKL